MQSAKETLDHKAAFTFSSKHSSLNAQEQILRKYKTDTAEQALRRAVASVVDNDGLNDIKYLLETAKVDMHAVSIAGKTPLQLCMEYGFNKLETPIKYKQALRFKLKAISYLLTKNDNLGILREVMKFFIEFYHAYSEKGDKKDKGEYIGKQREAGFVFLFTLNDLLTKAHYVLELKKQWEAYADCKTYALQPILLCESHIDAGPALFAENLLPRLKKMGYKMIAMEYYRDMDLSDCLSVAQKKFNENEKIYTSDGRMASERNIRLFKRLQEQDLLFKTIDLDKYVAHETVAHFEQMAEREYGLIELGMPLRDKGMFYNLAMLAAQHDGAVIGIVGISHGLPIINQFIDQGMAETEWLKVIPYEDPSHIGIGQHILIDEDGSFMDESRTLLARGAVDLCLHEDALVDSTARFLETLRQPEVASNPRPSC